MGGYRAVIGLEVHAQLKTRTKLFCSCPNEFGAEPNTRVCPVCLGLPGALPVPNREAVRQAVRFALAIGAAVHDRSTWARKNYFYPDLPKGYQISQFDRPLATGGRIRIEPAGAARREIGVHRVHLEEDAGKSVHEGFGGVVGGRDGGRGGSGGSGGGAAGGAGATGVDLNRCGVPLIEIVGEAEIHDPDEAYLYLERLKSTLRATDVCDADMEKGFLRCDANVSVHLPGTPWGTRVEIKNLNSFRHVRRALAHEIERQQAELAAGRAVVQETRLWNEAAGATQPMRGKEEAHDYRYFPDPDLPELGLDPALRRAAAEAMPELPAARRDRYEAAGVPEADAHRLTVEPEIADWFDAAAAASGAPRATANWVLSEVLGRLNKEGRALAGAPLAPARLGALVRLVETGAVTGKAAKAVFEEAWTTGADPGRIVAERGLARVEDAGAVAEACRAVVAAHPAQVAQYRGGKEAVLGFLVGKVMQATRGTAAPAAVHETLRRLLAEGA